jgi:hypothetical protein
MNLETNAVKEAITFLPERLRESILGLDAIVKNSIKEIRIRRMCHSL